MHPGSFHIKTEDLAYWFFRFNGCLCLVNFLVHHERRGQEGTDVDVMAVRFPYRRELALSDRPMEDYPIFKSDDKIDIIIAEIKLGTCNLNGPWTNPERGNMRRVLYAIGAFQEAKIEPVTGALYEDQYYEDDLYRFRLFALGKDPNPQLPSPVVQLAWNEVSRFVFERFTKYESYKTQHRQWDTAGQRLFWQAIHHRRNPDEFIKIINDSLEA